MDILEKARENFKSASEYYAPIYQLGVEDRNFAYGDQWDDAVKSEREKEARPCLVENRLLPFVHQVVNEIRQQRPRIRPIPIDDNADVEQADILAGIIRNIEKQSDAESAYDTAAKNAVESGLGYIRILTDYADYDSFDQEIRIERIVNPESVLLDPNHKFMDGRDAEYAFVFDDVAIDVFKSQYPDAELEGFEQDWCNDGWKNDDTVRVAEYFYKEYEKKRLVKLYTGEVLYRDEVEGLDEVLIQAERTVDACKIKWVKMIANEILEETEFLGKYIPIVPVVGEEVFLNGKRDFHSLIRQARDPQYMLNIWKSASTEIIGLQPKAPYIGYTGQFQDPNWVDANVRNIPFLQVDPTITDANGTPLPVPQRQPAPQGSAAIMQEAMAAAEAIKSTLGMYDASAGENTDDVSGKAIIARQLKGDNATFHFVDNLVTAMKQVGRILVDLIPLVYTDKRILKIIGEDGMQAQVAINQPVVKEGDDYRPVKEGERTQTIIRLDQGKYDIDMDVGASYATRRQEQANAIIELARVNPEILNIAGDLLVKSLDIPLSQEIAERIQSTMNPALLSDDPKLAELQQATQTIQQLQQQLQEADAALQVKANNQQFDNELKLEELKLKREELQMKAASEMAKINNDKMQIQAEAVKDYAEAQKMSSESIKELQDAFNQFRAEMDDTRGAVELILDKGMSSGETETPETESKEDETEKE